MLAAPTKRVLTALAMLVLTADAIAQVIGSDFEAGADGWKTRDYFTGGSQATPTFDGHAIGTTDTADLVAFSAPGPKYTGDKILYFGGTIQFDLFDAMVSASTSATYTLAIGTNSPVVAGATILHWYGGQPSSVDFSHFSALLSPDDTRWQLGGGPTGGGVAPTVEQFTAILRDITFIYVNADWHDGDSDFSRLDNFKISAVPELPSISMFSVGFLSLALLARRRYRHP